MKQHKHIKSIRLLIGLVLLIGLNQTTSAQLAGNLWGQITIGDPTTLINGDLINKPTGELFLGAHSPRGLQTNMLSITGNYVGENGSRIYVSVTDNSNLPNTRGYIDIVGTATNTDGATLIVLDYFNASLGWDGSCIDLIRANRVDSDVETFRMNAMTLNSRIAVLRYRTYDNSVIWYLAQKLIMSWRTDAQSTCLNEPLEPLSVLTAPGDYNYQWYRCNADGSNLVNLGVANGAQTAHFTPPSNRVGTSYYRCIVTSIQCDFNTDTTDVSGAITIGSPIRIITQPISQIVSNDGSITNVTLSIVADGEGLTYQWYRNGVAIASETNADLNINLTDGNIYEYYVEVMNACDGSVRSETAMVGYCLPILAQKRNHTLVVNNNPISLIEGGNGGYEFVYYAWYRNNELFKSEAGGEPGSFNKGGYYYTGGSNLNPNDAYYVIMRDVNNREYQTCVYYPIINISANVIAYPIPLTSSSSYIATVDAEVSDEATLDGATIDVYDTAGKFLGRTRVTGRYTQVSLPSIPGVYVLVFKSSEIDKEIKIIVE